MDADGNRSNNQNDDEKQTHSVRRFMLGWLVALNKGITRLLKKALGPDYMAVTEDEVLDMVNALAQTQDEDSGDNVIEESSAQMINNIFEFRDLTAGDVMTHRTNIVGWICRSAWTI